MAFVSNGSSHTLRTYEGRHFLDMNFPLVTAFDLKLCLRSLKLPISLHTNEPVFELPSDISSMGIIGSSAEPQYFLDPTENDKTQVNKILLS